MNEFPLKELINEGFSFDAGGKVMDWEFITDDEHEGRWRLYFKPEPCHSSCYNECDKKHGFYFASVEWAGNNCDDPTWSGETYIEVLYRGVACFDGLRHIYLGSEKTDNYGYINYPNAKIHAEIWFHLSLLEEKYCRED